MAGREVPLVDLKAQYDRIGPEIDAAIARVVDRGWFILGQELTAFEEAFAGYCGVAHGIGVGSGTEALHLALVAVGAEPGREVIAPANTAVPTISAISASGAKPVLADVDEAAATLDPGQVDRLITEKTAAVVAVHLYGQCAATDELNRICSKASVPLVEDAAQAHGATFGRRRAGGLGGIAAFSFYPSKNLGAYGDGGMITTDDGELASSLRRLRNYGEREDYQHGEIGVNSRLDEIQAAILGAKLPYLDRWNEERRTKTARYMSTLAGLPIRWFEDQPDRTQVRHLCVIRISDRDRLSEHLSSHQIRTKVHYPIPIHLQEAYRFLGHKPGDFPISERLASEVLSLPLYPELPDAEQDHVIERIHEWFRMND